MRWQKRVKFRIHTFFYLFKFFPLYTFLNEILVFEHIMYLDEIIINTQKHVYTLWETFWLCIVNFYSLTFQNVKLEQQASSECINYWEICFCCSSHIIIIIIIIIWNLSIVKTNEYDREKANKLMYGELNNQIQIDCMLIAFDFHLNFNFWYISVWKLLNNWLQSYTIVYICISLRSLLKSLI
jgi:hypothetical protein